MNKLFYTVYLFVFMAFSACVGGSSQEAVNQKLITRLCRNVQREFEVNLPTPYQKFLLNWGGNIHFLKQNSLPYQFFLLPTVRQTSKKAIRQAVRYMLMVQRGMTCNWENKEIQIPFCIATKEKDNMKRTYYYIDLAEDVGSISNSRDNPQLPVYKEKCCGTIEMCSPHIDVFMSDCITKIKKKNELKSIKRKKKSQPVQGNGKRVK